jgi:predicted DNA binding protein
VHVYPITHLADGSVVSVRGIQVLDGKEENIRKYVSALKKNKKMRRIERISDNAFWYETFFMSNSSYYASVYNPQLVYASPIQIADGVETFEIATWDKKLLQNIAKEVGRNPNTTYLKILQLKRSPAQKVFLPQILPHLTARQREVLHLARQMGYWQYPRLCNLGDIAKRLKLSKASVHETLRRAEARMLDYFI